VIIVFLSARLLTTLETKTQKTRRGKRKDFVVDDGGSYWIA
jgi:hypothetical protein